MNGTGFGCKRKCPTRSGPTRRRPRPSVGHEPDPGSGETSRIACVGVQAGERGSWYRQRNHAWGAANVLIGVTGLRWIARLVLPAGEPRLREPGTRSRAKTGTVRSDKARWGGGNFGTRDGAHGPCAAPWARPEEVFMRWSS